MSIESITDTATKSLRRELRSVARDADALLRATADIADDTVQEARDRAASTLRRAQKMVGNGRLSAYTREAAYHTARYARSHPWRIASTVAALAAAGILVSLFTRRRY